MRRWNSKSASTAPLGFSPRGQVAQGPLDRLRCTSVRRSAASPAASLSTPMRKSIMSSTSRWVRTRSAPTAKPSVSAGRARTSRAPGRSRRARPPGGARWPRARRSGSRRSRRRGEASVGSFCPGSIWPARICSLSRSTSSWARPRPVSRSSLRRRRSCGRSRGHSAARGTGDDPRAGSGRADLVVSRSRRPARSA